MSERFNNRCDGECPLAALNAARNRLEQGRTGGWSRVAVLGKGVLRGVEQMGNAWTCPSGNTEGSFVPSDHCIQEVKERLSSVDPAKFTPTEHRLLDPYFQPVSQVFETPPLSE